MGCVTENPDPTPTPVPVDPCFIFDQLGNLPPNCNSGGGGNGGGGNGGGQTDACTNEATDPGIQTSGPCTADDVCPDMVGIQTVTSECPASGGGGGGGTGIGTENGGVSGSGGGGGGGGLGGYLTFASTTTATSTATTTGTVLGSASSTPASCDMYLTAFIKFGNDNDTEQVKRLQYVLKMFEGADVEENGEYDVATRDAVHSFQSKYAEMILAPWSIKQSTGFVYLTTRKKVNEIYCSHSGVEAASFPLSEEENEVIEKTKVTVVPQVAPVTTRAAATTRDAVKTAPKTVGKVLATSTDSESPVARPWGSVGEFFRRVFNRGE